MLILKLINCLLLNYFLFRMKQVIFSLHNEYYNDFFFLIIILGLVRWTAIREWKWKNIHINYTFSKILYIKDKIYIFFFRLEILFETGKLLICDFIIVYTVYNEIFKIIMFIYTKIPFKLFYGILILT